MQFKKNVLACNGYPINFFESCLSKFLTKKHTACNSEVVYGPDRKCVVLCLPYTGDICVKIRRQLLRLVESVAPWIQLKVVFKPVLKLSVLARLKSPVI